jgi:ABC-type nitrate/sulfonate/bicarbonate transport system permease component
VSWFSLVAAEMVSGQYGLGYIAQHLVHNGALSHHRHRDVTLGAVSYITSAMVRLVGDYLMQSRRRRAGVAIASRAR